eukprot:CAMPEP_0179480666 /NCGR_PEP_ID=MMETSP0799-20121207/58578_1 /TAXON_ID=46947 /ORGANISM="Geminigera cryophila, Strain CCMP2564" /LENGTH=80 /DNA_ID=CAMNT_0021292869 /DNA_START=51 /DNA_END=289 /DNA_ORIENTATION=-
MSFAFVSSATTVCTTCSPLIPASLPGAATVSGGVDVAHSSVSLAVSVAACAPGSPNSTFPSSSLADRSLRSLPTSSSSSS